MSDAKLKKNSWFSWVIIGMAFIIVIVSLLFSFIRRGTANSRETAQETFILTAGVWASELKNDIESALDYSGIIEDHAIKSGKDLLDQENVVVIESIADHSDFYNIMLYKAGKGIVDITGEKYGVSLLENYLPEEGIVKTSYFDVPDDGNGRTRVVLIACPIGDNGDGVLFWMDPSEVADTFIKSGYEDYSFAVLFKKDGTIIDVLDGFADSNSNFLTEGSFLSPIQSGAEREDYNYFKNKLYNDSGCAIHCNYMGEDRTIACFPVVIEDWYIGIGVREYLIEGMVNDLFKDLKSIVIKLVVVLGVFVCVSLGLLIYTISKNKERGRKLEDKADMDMLTELTNKSATERMIAEYITDHPNGHGVLFILDIDNFKKVNDTMGHAFGDTLLKTLGKEIRTEFRVTDIVGRTGGDEFMIFLKDVNDDLIVEREANRITRFFHDFKAGGDYVKYSATASIGVAIYPSDGSTFKDLYVAADQALYRAKKRGKNQLVFYDEEKYGKT